MQWIYQEKVERLEKSLTWFTPLVSSMAAIIFVAEEHIDEEAGGRKSFFFYASNYFDVFCKLNVVDFQKITMDWIENYQLVSSCQAASCPPWTEVKISTQKQIYNIWQDRYWAFFSGSNKMLNATFGVHSQIEFTLHRATEAELLWFGELRQVYKPENNPIRLFWVLKGFSWRFVCVFFISQINKPWYNVLIFLLAIPIKLQFGVLAYDLYKKYEIHQMVVRVPAAWLNNVNILSCKRKGEHADFLDDMTDIVI